MNKTNNSTERPDGRFTSRMLSALTCPKRFEVEYIRNLRRSGGKPWPYPPNIKDVLSLMLRQRDLALATGKSRQHAESDARVALHKWEADVFDSFGASAGRKMEKIAEQSITIGRESVAIYNHYDRVHACDFDNQVKVYKPKERMKLVSRLLEFKLPNKGFTESSFSFAGVIDRVDIIGDDLVLIFRHFTSRADTTKIEQELQTSFDWRGLAFLVEKETGKEVATILFDVVRTKAPMTPGIITCKKCSGRATEDACLKCNGTGVSGISKASCDTTAEIWKSEVAKNHHLNFDDEVRKAGKLLEKLHQRGDVFAWRNQIRIGDISYTKGSPKDQWLKDTCERIRTIEQFKKNGYWPRNTYSCSGRGLSCPYLKPCSGFLDSNDPFFMKVDDEYPGIAPVHYRG